MKNTAVLLRQRRLRLLFDAGFCWSGGAFFTAGRSLLFLAFSMVSFQKSGVVSVSEGGIFVVCEKQRIQLGRNLRRTDPFKHGEVPGMLAFFAAVDQPDVDLAAVCVNPELAAVDKFLLLSASAATVIDPDR